MAPPAISLRPETTAGAGLAGWGGRIRTSASRNQKSPDKAKGRKDRNVRLKERPCNPCGLQTAKGEIAV
jgi:hypothetical protein